MNADTLLVFVLGMVSGGLLGWCTAWRHALKLEHFGVQLWRWHKPYDMQSAPDNAVPFRQSQR